MKKLTDKEKLKYYKLALPDIKYNNFVGICETLHFHYFKYRERYLLCDEIPSLFIELSKYKPKNISYGYWWSVDNRKTRIKVLTEIIEQLELKIKKHERNNKVEN